MFKNFTFSSVLTYSQTNHTPGARASYTCNSGYEFVGRIACTLLAAPSTTAARPIPKSRLPWAAIAQLATSDSLTQLPPRTSLRKLLPSLQIHIKTL
jgi:hypothetical protein